MGKDSGSDTQKTTSTTTPWGPQAEQYKVALGDLGKLYQQGGLYINPFPGQTVASQAPQTVAAQQGITNRAQSGSPLNQAAGQYVQRTLDPGYLNSDSPGLQSVLDNAANDVNARFSMAGRTFSGAHAGSLGSAFGNIRYQDYQNKMGQQERAAGMAPGLAREDYFDLNQLGQVGTQREAYMQDLINAEINKYNQLQRAPANELALYQQLIGGNLGGTTTGTQPKTNQTNPFLTALGTLGSIATPFLL